MDVTYQTMDQLLISSGVGQAATSQGPKAQAESDSRDDFGSMVRQKSQEAKGQAQPEKTVKGQVKQNTGDAPDDDQEITGEQYVMAAALLFQPMPEARYTEIQTDVSETPVQVPVEEIIPTLGTQELSLVNLVNEDAPETEAPVILEAGQFSAPTEMEATPDLPDDKFNPPEKDAVNHNVQQAVQAQEDQIEDSHPMENVVHWEAPLFGYLDAAPVKVAAAETVPLDLQAEDGLEQLGERIEDLLMSEAGDSRVEFTLTPASLGKIVVQVTHDKDGALHVLLSATTTKAAALLERHTGGLQNLLTSYSRPEVNVEVRGSGETPQQFLNPNGDNGQRQQQQQQQRQRQTHQQNQARDFIQQLRLGLVSVSDAGVTQ